MARGRHRIYVGSAPGTGATTAVLDEARRRVACGAVVVVGAVQAHGRPLTHEVLERLDGLEVAPRAEPALRGRAGREMDLDGLLARHPDVVVVDDLAHTNAPGSRQEKRWQDVDDLLAAGTDVISTIDVQHLAPHGDADPPSATTRGRETVPDEVLCRADEIELVDLSPAALRERALPWLADRVDQRRRSSPSGAGAESTRPARERVVVALSGGAEGEDLLRRGARIASGGAGGELLAVHVAPVDGRSGPPPPGLRALRLLTEELDGTWHPVTGESPAEAILDVARGVHASHVVVGSTRRSRWRTLPVPSTAEQVISHSGDIDVHVVTQSPSTGLGARPSRAALRRRRVRLGYVLALLGPMLLTTLLVLLPGGLAPPLATPLYLLLTVLVAVLGGIGPALVGVVSSSLLITWFLAPPVGEVTISAQEDAVALAVFVVVTVGVALVVHRGEHRAERAVAAQHEAATLADLTHTLLASPDPMHLLLERAVDMFGARRARIVRRATADMPPEVVAESDPGVPQATGRDGSRFDDETVAPADHAHDLVLVGVHVPPDGQRLLEAFATHAAAILQRRALQRSAGGAVALVRVGPRAAGLPSGGTAPSQDGAVEPSATA
ncbi:MAG TPA: DUF4118 domain-containing protein [Ornithinibacter sp.]|nr:DUF4118 domain-containing protein [Ornithinibacter sp.]